MADQTRNEESSHNKHNDPPAGGKDKKLPENSKESLDEKLDEAVEETFPASDPVSVKITK